MISERIENPGAAPEWAREPGGAMTELPCGCHIRRGDFETVLCDEHLDELNEQQPVDMGRESADSDGAR